MPTLEEDLNTFRIFRGFASEEEKAEDENGEPIIRARIRQQLTETEGIPEPLEEALSEPEIDLRVLAEKIYALFKQELVLERERAARRISW